MKNEKFGAGTPIAVILEFLHASKSRALKNQYRRYSSQMEDAEDAVNDFLLRFSEKVSSGQICPPNYDSYVYVSFRNFCMDRFKKNNKSTPVDFSSVWHCNETEDQDDTGAGILQAGTDPSDILHNRMIMDAMRLCLTQLKPRDRKVLLMRYMEDMKNPEIAKSIGLSTAATANVLKRALAALRAIFKSRNIEPW